MSSIPYCAALLPCVGESPSLKENTFSSAQPAPIFLAHLRFSPEPEWEIRLGPTIES